MESAHQEVVFVIFMLLQREDLRDRVLRLVGASDVARLLARDPVMFRRHGRLFSSLP